MKTSPTYFNYLCSSLVPDFGQATTVQGELLRSIMRLFDEGYRNGNGNWDNGFELMCDFLESTLLASNLFSDQAKDEIKYHIKIIREYNNVPKDNVSYDYIADRVVDFCDAHPTPISRDNNPDLKR